MFWFRKHIGLILNLGFKNIKSGTWFKSYYFGFVTSKMNVNLDAILIIFLQDLSND